MPLSYSLLHCVDWQQVHNMTVVHSCLLLTRGQPPHLSQETSRKVATHSLTTVPMQAAFPLVAEAVDNLLLISRSPPPPPPRSEPATQPTLPRPLFCTGPLWKPRCPSRDYSQVFRYWHGGRFTCSAWPGKFLPSGRSAVMVRGEGGGVWTWNAKGSLEISI
jgi:hypothetical protein